MKYCLFLTAMVMGSSLTAFGSEDITLKIESLTNVRGNGALEACGSAVHAQGVKPLLVTIKHDESYYTTLTALNDQWCVLFKRWTFSGKVEVSAATLEQKEMGEVKILDLSKLDREE